MQCAPCLVASSPPPIKRAVVARAEALPAAIGAQLLPRMVAWDAQHMASALAALRVPLLVIQCTCLNADRVRVSIEPGDDTPWLATLRRFAPHAASKSSPASATFRRWKRLTASTG